MNASRAFSLNYDAHLSDRPRSDADAEPDRQARSRNRSLRSRGLLGTDARISAIMPGSGSIRTRRMDDASRANADAHVPIARYAEQRQGGNQGTNRPSSPRASYERKRISLAAAVRSDLSAARSKPQIRLFGGSNAEARRRRCMKRHKLVTYPRTDSRYLPDDMRPKIRKRAFDACRSRMRRSCARRSDEPEHAFQAAIMTMTRISDHHAIVPTDRKPNLSALNPDEAQDLRSGRAPPDRRALSRLRMRQRARDHRGGRASIQIDWYPRPPFRAGARFTARMNPAKKGRKSRSRS